MRFLGKVRHNAVSKKNKLGIIARVCTIFYITRKKKKKSWYTCWLQRNGSFLALLLSCQITVMVLACSGFPGFSHVVVWFTSSVAYL